MNKDNIEVSLSSIEEIIEDARNGKMYILVDDPDRENEGDLIIPAQYASPQTINFMAKHGRGLICLALTKERIEELELPLMNPSNIKNDLTAFTVSIEAKEGVTTGISAADRAHTISVAINNNRNKNDLVYPGHVFPLMAWDGGVLVRAGHTEAAVDISKLADLNPSGVICEIMSEDGSMARLPEIIKFAKLHNLKVGTVSDLIKFRLKKTKIVEQISERPFESEMGSQFTLKVFQNTISGEKHYALVKNLVDNKDPKYVRMHKLDVTKDILPNEKIDCVVYGCTSGTIAAGYDSIEKKIKIAKPDAKVTTPSTASIKALKKLNLNKIAIFTPYPKKLNDEVLDFFKQENFEITSNSYFDIASDIDIGKVDSDYLFDVLSKMDLIDYEIRLPLVKIRQETKSILDEIISNLEIK